MYFLISFFFYFILFYFIFLLSLAAFIFPFGPSFLVLGQLSDRRADGRDESHNSRALTSITRARCFRSDGRPEHCVFLPFLWAVFLFFLFAFLWEAASWGRPALAE
jgi:hypothetical protein